MSSLTRKLRQTFGDSFAEAIVALLIAALGTAALATMVTTATNVTTINKEAMDATYADEIAIAEKVAPASDTVTITGSELGKTYLVPIDLYEGDRLTRYEVDR